MVLKILSRMTMSLPSQSLVPLGTLSWKPPLSPLSLPMLNCSFRFSMQSQSKVYNQESQEQMEGYKIGHGNCTR
ncbi:hypothetical protein KCU98_g97, partial [Aureobasidium melanogenum]